MPSPRAHRLQRRGWMTLLGWFVAQNRQMEGFDDTLQQKCLSTTQHTSQLLVCPNLPSTGGRCGDSVPQTNQWHKQTGGEHQRDSQIINNEYYSPSSLVNLRPRRCAKHMIISLLYITPWHRASGVWHFANEEDNDLRYVVSRCLEVLAAIHPDRAREARRLPRPPSNGIPPNQGKKIANNIFFVAF